MVRARGTETPGAPSLWALQHEPPGGRAGETDQARDDRNTDTQTLRRALPKLHSPRLRSRYEDKPVNVGGNSQDAERGLRERGAKAWGAEGTETPLVETSLS